MTSKLTRERLEKIKSWRETYGAGSNVMLPAEEAEELARMALAAMDSEPVALQPELAKVVYHFRDWNEGFPVERFKADYVISWMLANYPPAQPAPVVPENCVTAEHRRVIEMLLNVCGAAFELADDSCQQDIDGEDCHVVPDDAFQNLSDALDEIENTLPTEDIDRPDVFLAWSAMPRAALKSLLQAQPVPVVDADDNFYSWFGREWAENYQHNQYTTAAKQMLGVMAESAWKAGRRAAMLQENPVCTCPSGDGSLRWPCPVHPGSSPVIPDGYVMVPVEPTKEILDEFDSIIDYGAEDSVDAWHRLLAAAPQSPGSEPATVPGKWIPVSERMPELDTRVLLYFSDYSGHIEDGCIGDEGDGPYHYFFDGDSLSHEPTHWMQLPAGPQEVKGE